MKLRYILIVCFFLVIKTSSGQTNVYHPFPDSNAYWTTWFSSCVICDGSDYHYSIISDYMTGDTIINSKAYHKIWRFREDWVDFINDTTVSFDGYSTAIRQDTLQRKVYFIYQDTVEHVLYDFNITVGDTITPLYYIDSILINGDYRKRFVLQSWMPADTNFALIEGIGSTTGPFQPLYPYFEQGSLLECFSQNNINLYPGYGNCKLYTGIKEINKENKQIKIYPNPSSTTITISAKGINTYILSNTFGQVIKEGKLNGDETTIEVSALPNGIYILALDGRSFYKVSVMH